MLRYIWFIVISISVSGNCLNLASKQLWWRTLPKLCQPGAIGYLSNKRLKQNETTILGGFDKKNVTTDREVVNIKVFYESLCQGCRLEFSRALVPIIKHLHDKVNLEIFPYGNAQTVSMNKFKCQHGPAECYGNKIHACSLFKLKISLAVNYIACMMTEVQIAKMSHDEAAVSCSKSRNIDSEAIRRCAMSDLGNLLLLEAGLVTSAAKVRYVPYVLVNGKPVSGNLAGAVCSSFSNKALMPPACHWHSRKGVL